jgi:YidC/Oxa1 family membrane protein insertase
MDKKNTTIGVLLLIAAFASYFIGLKLSPPPPPAPQIGKAPAGNPLSANQATPQASAPTSPSDASISAAVSDEPEAANAPQTVLSNDFIEVRFTDRGGAIRNVALKKYDAEKDKPGVPYVFNQLHADPALAFVAAPGLDQKTRYQLVSANQQEVVYRTVFENRVEVTRRYTIVSVPAKDADPYQIRHETIFRNLTDQTTALPRASLSLGTAGPRDANDLGAYLATGHNVGGKVDFTRRGALEGGGFLTMFGIGSREPIKQLETPGPLLWGSVNNQFFTAILTPDQPVAGLATERVELPAFPGSGRPAYGVTGLARVDVPGLAPRADATFATSYYVGPKEYHRLNNDAVFKHDEDKVMQFGFFKFFSQILLTLMTWIHDHILGNSRNAWGFAIVLTTLSLKLIFLPLTLSASKSAKRMQKIQPEMQALREKYKDNPQKLQAETMAIFKKHRVNPVGGCLPVLITIPFFMGFFQMLQSTAELRFGEFLWAHDLSAQDTVAYIAGLPLNIMPLLLGATMVFQMRLVPQPTVDNAQAKMFKFMPIIFTVFCYKLSCALSLYSTVNGLFTIVQQLIINRMKDDEVTSPGGAAVATASTLGKAAKNVTPKKKK